jgi:hypothetical protein
MVNGIATLLLAASISGATLTPAPTTPVNGIHAATVRVAHDAARAELLALPPSAVVASRGKRSVARVVTGIVLGAAAGTFAGGFVGYKIERGFADCRCDDPGIRGLIIGAPIGAAIGAVLGGKFF